MCESEWQRVLRALKCTERVLPLCAFRLQLFSRSVYLQRMLIKSLTRGRCWIDKLTVEIECKLP